MVANPGPQRLGMTMGREDEYYVRTLDPRISQRSHIAEGIPNPRCSPLLLITAAFNCAPRPRYYHRFRHTTGLGNETLV